MTIPVIMGTGDVIDASYMAASSALPIRSLVHYGNNNVILIDGGRPYMQQWSGLFSRVRHVYRGV